MVRMIFLVLLLFLSPVKIYAEEPTVGALGAALVDGKTGRLLWGKNPEDELAMASTTKIMTAILVLEKADLEDIVTVSKNAANQPKVHMNLVEGEQWKIGDLLEAMMLRSYNDTAVALAEHISGSVEEFCAEMTKKAAEIGAGNTAFGSPNGLDSALSDESHHSTAYDMALIGAYAMENEKFKEVVATSAINISEVNGKRQVQVTNADRFLNEFEGAGGIKTGFTNKAGHCFVGAAERGDVALVSAVLASGWGDRGKNGKWTDTKAIMNYGFANFASYEIVPEGDICAELPVAHSTTNSVSVVFSEGYEALFSQEECGKLQVRCEVPEELEAPVVAGDEVGMARIWLDDACLAEIPLHATADAPRFRMHNWLAFVKNNWVDWLA